MLEGEIKMEIEFRIIDDNELPPLIIKKGENDKPKILINNHHRIWLSLNRAILAGISQALPEKINDVLNGYLTEQYSFEQMDRSELNE
jgi:hypothetical protein